MLVLKCGLCAAIVAACGAWLMIAAGAAEAQTTPPAGDLRCDVAGGVSFIVGSSRALDCVYQPAGGAPPEYYKGTINKVGIDIGFQTSGVIYWAVLSPGLTKGPGALAGHYIGASAEVAAGPGVMANALVGTNKIVLNPISVGGETGLNVAAGIADLDLVYVSTPPPSIRESIPFGD